MAMFGNRLHSGRRLNNGNNNDSTRSIQHIFGVLWSDCGYRCGYSRNSEVDSKGKSSGRVQNARIEAMEKRLFEIERMLDNDNKRLSETERGMRCIIKGMVAVLNGSIHGDNKQQMEVALHELQDYLTTK